MEIELLTKNLTESQKKFLRLHDNDVLVSASAGTGKTTSMIKKIVLLMLEKRVSISNMLVVTYTESAALEMKKKLYDEINKILPIVSDENLREFLLSELDKVSYADLGTLHSVCKTFVTKYFYEVDVDPSFSICVDGEQKFLFNKAIDEECYARTKNADEDFFRLYLSFSQNRNDDALRSVIKKLYEYLLSKREGEALLDTLLATAYNSDITKNTVLDYFYNYIKNEYGAFLAKGEEILERVHILKNEKVVESVASRVDFINEILAKNNFFDMCSVLKNWVFVRRSQVPKKAENHERELMEEYVDWAEKLKAQVVHDKGKLMLEFTPQEFLKNNEAITADIKALFSIVKGVALRYEEIKKKYNFLDYSDLEKKAIAIFENDAILSEIKNKYEYIFADEYQDFNEIQEYILTKIKRNNNLNMIGDLKQSIYEFRLSNPNIFLSKYYSKKNKLVLFNENFRSENNILGFVNNIFDVLMTKQTVGIDYASDARLISGKVVRDVAACGVHIIDTKSEDGERTGVAQSRDYEAQLCVEQIAKLVGTKYVSDGVEKEFSYKDIAILHRKNKEGAFKIYQALVANKIPVETTFSSDIFNSYEVSVLLSFLKVVANYRDSLSCAVVLKSPIINLSDGEIFLVAKSDDCEFWQKAEKYLGDKKIGQKLAKYFEILTTFREYAKYHSLYEVVEKLLNDFGLIHYFKSMPDGLEKESNIYEFLSLCLSESYKYSLSEFINFIESISEENYKLTTASDDNSVKLMTIHGSKGLGFPVVILLGLGDNLFATGNKETSLFINDKIGVGLNVTDSDLWQEKKALVNVACAIENRKKEFLEEIRVLYVALTRPQNRLILVGSCNASKITDGLVTGLKFQNSYLKFMLSALSLESLQLLKEGRENFYVFGGSAGKTKVNVYSPNYFFESKSEGEEILLQAPLAEISDGILEYLNYEYPFSQGKNIATKNSVTNILKEEVDYENTLYASKNLTMEEGAGSSATLRGTIVHEIMCSIGFDMTKAEREKVFFDVHEKYGLKEHVISFDKIFCAVERMAEIANGGSVTHEKQFSLRLPHKDIVAGSGVEELVIVQGVIDAIVDSGDAVTIVDFKTNRNSNRQFYIDTYALQLKIYALAYFHATGKEVTKKLIYSFELNEFIEC